MEDGFTKSTESAAHNEALEITLTKLAETREEIKRAREGATQSWLDSRPIIDELEKLQSTLSRTKNRVTMATIAISALESLIETTAKSIRSKQEECNARMSDEEMHKALDRTTVEKEKLKVQVEEEKRARDKLKEDLYIKRQSLRTLRLKKRAVSIETEAFKASVNAALYQIKEAKKDHEMVAISHEEYYALCRKADEDKALADWRVSASEEQRHAAEVGRVNALRRLEALSSEKQLRDMGMQGNVLMEASETAKKEAIGELRNINKPDNIQTEASLLHKLQPTETKKSISNRRNSKQRMRKLEGGDNKKLLKTKSSILQKIRNFLVRNLMYFR